MKKFVTISFVFIINLIHIFSASMTNVLIKNNTNTVVTTIYVIEEDNYPVNQTVNLESASKLEKLIKKLSKKKNSNNEEFESASLGKSEKLWALKTDVQYKILLENERGELFLRDHIKVAKDSENIVIEFKKVNKTDKRWISDYTKRQDEIVRKKQELRDLRKPQLILLGIAVLVVLIFVIVYFVDLKKTKTLGEKTFLSKLIGSYSPGKRYAEIAGVVIMFIPVVFSCLPYHSHLEKTYFWFFTHRIEKDISIQATMFTAIAAVFIYGSYLIRYDFFKKETAEQVIFSIVQTIVNVWALSGLCSMFVGNEIWNIPFINISSFSFLLLIALLSWIGARCISGFLWIALIIIEISHITEINNAMGIYGALYIIFMFISLLLQMSDIVHLQDFKNDFFGKTKRIGKRVKKDVDTSVEKAKKLI